MYIYIYIYICSLVLQTTEYTVLIQWHVYGSVSAHVLLDSSTRIFRMNELLQSRKTCCYNINPSTRMPFRFWLNVPDFVCNDC